MSMSEAESGGQTKDLTFEELCEVIRPIAEEYGMLRVYLSAPGPAATTVQTVTTTSVCLFLREWDCSRWADFTVGSKRHSVRA